MATPRWTFGSLFAGFTRGVQTVVLALGAGLLVVWTIDPAREALTRLGWVDESSIFGVIGVVLVVAALVLGQMDKALGGLAAKIDRFAPPGGTEVIEGGVGNIYGPLRRALAACPPQHCRLDVLGLTLYSAWPNLHQWLVDETTRNWTVRFCSLSPGFIRSQPTLPADWADHAATQLRSIEFFRSANADRLRARRVVVEVFEYAFFPAVHGFRLGDGTVFISFTHWAGADADSRVDSPHQAYLHLSAGDFGLLAQSQRALFENWFGRACSAGPAPS